MHLRSSIFQHPDAPAWVPVVPHSFGSGSDPDDGPGKPASFARASSRREDLPYIIELWDEAKTTVEQVLAVTGHGSIGYAAYYAAIREYPGRFVTLRHRNRTVARSNSPQD